MQPHSMCYVAAVNFFMNPDDQSKGKVPVQMSVIYQKLEGKTVLQTKTLKYELSNFKVSKNFISVNIVRGGGGLSCTVSGSINSDKHVITTHGVQHVADLHEEFDLYKESIRRGKHRNSKKYGDFWGIIYSSKKMKMRCSIKQEGKSDKEVDYELEVTGVRFLDDKQRLIMEKTGTLIY